MTNRQAGRYSPKATGGGEIDPPHYYIEGQLLFATQGVMLVETGDRRWVIPPQRALWLPTVQ